MSTDARSEIAARLERAGLPGEDAAEASEALTDLAAGRARTRFVVRVANPAREVDGWGSTHTVVQIVIDDIPFVADSVTAVSRSAGSEVHRLVEVRHGGRALLHVEIDRESDPGVLASLRAGIEDVLGDVRIAVVDWPAMRDEVQRLAATLRSDPPVTFDRHDVAEAATSSSGWPTTTSRSSVASVSSWMPARNRSSVLCSGPSSASPGVARLGTAAGGARHSAGRAH